ncbi:MAG: type II secretion system secretin GspD [Succinivibrionaceae bacterium]|nr:type II secretion system secretin GspD [Succinivibrionaceae bacterium]
MKISKIAAAVALILGCCGTADAAQYSASFKNTEITEFINTVGRNLHKNMVIDPTVKGKINIRSYDVLDDEEYYQFFLSVLELYGLSAVPVGNQTIKVVKSMKAKAVGIPLYDDEHPGQGAEMVARVVPVENVSVKELSPLLRQMVDLTEGGNVVHYEPSNVLIITGRANVVNRVIDVVKRVDKAGNQDVDIIKVRYASASELVRLVNNLLNDDRNKNTPTLLKPKIEADERSNSIVVSGEPNVRKRVIQLIRRLDQDQEYVGNTKVVYLKYAKAKNVVEVLNGLGNDLDKEKSGGNKTAGNTSNQIKFGIYADEETNSIIINAQPDLMQQIEAVISKLDIRRAQVYVEAIIVEVANTDAAQFGVQWANTRGGGTNFSATSAQTSLFPAASNDDIVGSVASGVYGGVMGFYSGNWMSLATALRTDNRSNVLSTPSIVTLDNQPAEFTVGQEVPVVTGSQSSLASDTSNIYKTVERKSVGTKLKFTPQINEGDSVRLEMEQEVSSVDNATANSDYGPTFNMRNIKNSVLVKSGETVVLGGLISEDEQEVVSKVPILGDIPFLGALFRATSTSKEKRNLMVFIHPVILRDPDTYTSISRNKYTKFRAEQLERYERGIPLLPDEVKIPLLKEYERNSLDLYTSDNGGFKLTPEDVSK